MKLKVISEKSKWLRLLNQIRGEIIVAVNLFPSKVCNGWYITRKKEKPAIIIFYPKGYKNYSCKSSILIHEYGHFLQRLKKFKTRYKEEVSAWVVGERAIDKSLIPKNFNRYKALCLRSYKVK